MSYSYTYSDDFLRNFPTGDFYALYGGSSVNDEKLCQAIIWHCNHGMCNSSPFKQFINSHLSSTDIVYIKLFIPNPEVIPHNGSCDIPNNIHSLMYCICDDVILYLIGQSETFRKKRFLKTDFDIALKLDNERSINVLAEYFTEYLKYPIGAAFNKLSDTQKLKVTEKLYQKYGDELPDVMLDVYYKPGNPGFDKKYKQLIELGEKHNLKIS